MALKTPRSVYSIDHIKYKFWLYYNFICDLIKQGTNSKRKDILGIFIVLHLTVSVVWKNKVLKTFCASHLYICVNFDGKFHLTKIIFLLSKI